MKNKVIVLLLVVLVGLVIYFLINKNNSDTLVSPGGLLYKVTPTPPSTPTPIEYHFDSSTNLKQELNSINPKVETTDFDNLKKIINQL